MRHDNNYIILATPAPISHRTAEENLGIGYLAAVLRKNNYEVEIIDGWLADFTPEQISSLSQNLNALNLFKKYHIYVQAGQILFDPETTLKELYENYQYMKKYDWIISIGLLGL